MARKAEGTISWHFCNNCPEWPRADYVEGDGESDGEKCRECLRKIRIGNCLTLM